MHLGAIMNKDNKNVDKILFPSIFATKISKRLSTLILAIVALGILNTLPDFIKYNIFADSHSILQILGNSLMVLLIIIINGAFDASIFCIPALGLSSTLMETKDETKGTSYLFILIKLYFLTHLPLKFVEYSLSILDFYKNFGIGFLSNYYFLLSIQIILVSWFSLSIARCLRKLLSITKTYETSLVLGAFGWFNLISMAMALIMEYVFKLLLQYHF